MKTSASLFAFLFAVTFTTTTSYAQAPKVGVGVGINTSSLLGAITEGAFISSTGIYIPVVMPPSLRFEPNVAFARAVSKNGSSKVTATSVQIGAGLFATQSVGTATNVYFGVRSGTAFSKSKNSFGPNSSSSSKTDFFVGPAVGGEHFFGDNFSLGAEVQAIFVILGNENENSDVSSNLMFTNSIFFVRVYM